ncbi:MAG TPA: 2,3-bisphosphoglycerate-independent phosphoglycerate mutase [Myxococcales bacterium]|nr:2,3-bisphosphoglycerate-independent phosphoglycerate mutase [Myxococcales bacterium]
MSLSPLKLIDRREATVPVVLAVMDGVGLGPLDEGNAVHLAHTPHLDRLWNQGQTRTLRAHGTSVGLPNDSDMGNSEVGHNALGAGRVVRQGAGLVNDAFATGELFKGHTWGWLTETLAGRMDRTLHLCGLLSDGNIHAHFRHVRQLINGAAEADVRRLRVHALADGRDVEDPSYERWLTELDEVLNDHQQAGRDFQLASGGGRMVVTMDRYDADWSIVQRGWQAHVLGQAPGFEHWHAALKTLRAEPGGQSDQTLRPFCIVDKRGDPVGVVNDGDSFVFWNFRGDRAIELSRAFEQGDDFAAFDRVRRPQVRYAGMMQYDGDLQIPARFLVSPPVIDRTMGDYMVIANKRTLAVSETQKFGHVTYFWNGNKSGLLDKDLEEYVEIPSDRLSFDQAPAMQAAEITDVVIEALKSEEPPDFIRLNWPNGDMVGHTGDMAAVIAAVEMVDQQVGRLLEVAREVGAVVLITADHGNADDMWMRDKKGQARRDAQGRIIAKTSHTLSVVPFSLVDPRPTHQWRYKQELPDAGLANVAATMLQLLGLESPAHMEPSLIEPL